MRAKATDRYGASQALVAILGHDAVDSRLLGGKGASLDRLSRLGFTVPPGFCLTTEAFATQLDAIADQSTLQAAMAALPNESARADLVALIERSPLAPRLARALDAAVLQLAGSAPAPLLVAVRSSTADEDGTVTSFAGLHETDVGVAPEGIADAVRRCWASLWSPAATAYRVGRAISLIDVAMAVVVQSLVPAEAAAVVFTRHPVTGRQDQILINAVRGLGEPMVAGTVTPDSMVVDKATRAVIETSMGDAIEAMVARDHGVSSVSRAPGTRPATRDTDLAHRARLRRRGRVRCRRGS